MNLASYKIGILYGGESNERKVSLKSGEAVYEALKREGLNVSKIDVHRDIMKVLEKEKIELAFLALHGGWGEDGTIQALCKLMGIPFTGPDILGSALALDKVLTKKVLESSGIPTPPYMVISKKDVDNQKYLGSFIREVDRKIGFPVILKPALEGSSVGLKIVRKIENLRESIESSLYFGNELLIEKYLTMTETTVGILGLDEDLEVLPIVEIVPKSGIYDFESKYTPGATEYIIPARLPEKIYKKVQEVALQTFKVLKLDIISRIDVLVEGNKDIYVTEANTNPGMTPTSLYPKAAAKAGYEFSGLLVKMLELALKRKENEK